MWHSLKLLPKNHISWFFGRIMSVRLPAPLNSWLVKAFARMTGASLEEASLPAEGYRSLSEFFVRDLKPGLRPVRQNEKVIVSPVDGCLRNAGKIIGCRVPQVKGRDYGVAEFLADTELGNKFQGGTFFNFYLSPRDYHHIHCPLKGRIVRRIYIPGKLWPVNDWSIQAIENLFSINERVVLEIQSSAGTYGLVMVGATNVGKISLTHDSLITNRLIRGKKEVKVFNPEVEVAAGEKLGTFHFGSSVVLLFQPGHIAKISGQANTPVKFGAVMAECSD